jgi:hypothetical protein
MVGWGAPLAADEKQALVAYLTTLHPATSRLSSR